MGKITFYQRRYVALGLAMQRAFWPRPSKISCTYRTAQRMVEELNRFERGCSLDSILYQECDYTPEGWVVLDYKHPSAIGLLDLNEYEEG